MTVTLVISGTPAAELLEASRHPLETAGVLRAVLVRAPNGDLRLLTRGIDWVSERAYAHRSRSSLGITSEGYVSSLGKAEAGGEIAIWLHTHPGDGAAPQPSLRDHHVDDDIRDIFQLRTGSGYYGTLIISPCGTGLAFTGTLQHEDGRQIRIERLWNISDAWSLTRSIDSPEPPIPAMFDRNVRAFGGGVQLALGALRVGIVGCGGTGSAVAEQLARLGVRHFHLIDPDKLSISNVTRVYGSFPYDVGKPKVEIVHRHLSAIAPDIECSETVGVVTDEKIARQLISCDLIFGCTDDNAGRMVLSRIASYLMTPVVDLGVLLSSDAHGKLIGIDGRVTVMTPGAACLLCRNRIDIKRAAAEQMTESERTRLAGEGYAPALGGIEPAVISFTTAVATAATAELLERLTSFGPQPRPSEILLRFHEREVSTNIVVPRQHHYCHPASGKFGLGNATPWLEQMWRQT